MKLSRDLQYRFLGRKACKMGLVKWYNFGLTEELSPVMQQELLYWKEDIVDFLSYKKLSK
jgi:hypothetical protein